MREIILHCSATRPDWLGASSLSAKRAEKGLGVDVPGVALGADWMLVMMNALGLGTLRHGIEKAR